MVYICKWLGMRNCKADECNYDAADNDDEQLRV